MKQIVLIFARYPEPGQVKTRLSPDLTPGGAAALYTAMVDDVVSLHAAGEAHDTIVRFTPDESRDDFRSWLGEDVRLMPQRGDDLGSRQLNAFRQAFHMGYDKVIIIGSDCPLVTRDDIATAFDVLEGVDLVLGPSEDGGYYLIGARQAYDCLFEDIGWGGSRVLEDTLKRAEHAGIASKLLDRKFDIDRFEDVRRLYSVLKQQESAQRDGSVIASKTFEVLDSLLGGGD